MYSVNEIFYAVVGLDVIRVSSLRELSIIVQFNNRLKATDQVTKFLASAVVCCIHCDAS